MKKLICASAALFILFTACKKSNNSSSNIPYGVSAKINGKLTNFGVEISVDTTNGEVDIIGLSDSTWGAPRLNILISPNSGPVKTGLYPNLNIASLNQSASGLDYIVSAGGGSSNSVMYASSDDSVTVTSVSSTSISGTFHGTADNHYFDPNAMTFKDSIITITEGTFNVKF